MGEEQDPKTPQIAVIHMITFAITMSILILMYVAYTIPVEAYDDGVSSTVVTILSSLSIVVITLSAFLRGWLFKYLVSASRKEPRALLSGELFVSQIITLVVREFGVILCFVCTLRTAEFEYVLYAGLAAVFLNIVTWPREVPRK